MRAAVLGTRDWNGLPRAEVHKNTVNFIALDDREEAIYVCGLLNSSYVTAYALASSVRGGKGFAGVNLLDTICIPKYDSNSDVHTAVVQVGTAAYENPAAEDREELDRVAAAVCSIPADAIVRIRETAAAFQ